MCKVMLVIIVTDEEQNKRVYDKCREAGFSNIMFNVVVAGTRGRWLCPEEAVLGLTAVKDELDYQVERLRTVVAPHLILLADVDEQTKKQIEASYHNNEAYGTIQIAYLDCDMEQKLHTLEQYVKVGY